MMHHMHILKMYFLTFCTLHDVLHLKGSRSSYLMENTKSQTGKQI